MIEEPFKLPTGWSWVRLGDIFDFQQGASMSPMRRRGIAPKPFLRTLNVRWGHVDILNVDEMDFTEEEVSKLSLRIGDLLVCEGGDVGRTAIWRGELETCLYQNHVHRLRRRTNNVMPEFYMYWMQAAYQVFDIFGGQESRTAIPNLSGRRLKEFIAPFLPLDEQRHIVEKLEALMERVREAKRLRAEASQDADHLMRSTLAEIFFNPRDELPSDWVSKKVVDVSDELQYGYTQSAKWDPVGPKFLRITDIHNGGVKWENVPFCGCGESAIDRYKLNRGDILFARSGATTGKTFLVQECPEAVFASYLIRVRLRPEINPEYIFWFFQSPYYWNQIKPRGAAQPNINARILGNLLIPLPLSEHKQRHIVSYIEQVHAKVTSLRRAQEATKKELQHLEQAILDKAFRGEL